MSDAKQVPDLKFLSIERCPIHGWYAIAIVDESGGTRLTPSKCCGQWETIKRWPLTKDMGLEIIKEVEAAIGVKR